VEVDHCLVVDRQRHKDRGAEVVVGVVGDGNGGGDEKRDGGDGCQQIAGEFLHGFRLYVAEFEPLESGNCDESRAGVSTSSIG
jgi:hypothetical protein